MNDQAQQPAPISQTNLDQLGSPSGDVGISSFATHNSILAALNTDKDDEDDFEFSTSEDNSTGQNADPEDAKLGGYTEVSIDAPGAEEDGGIGTSVTHRSSEDTDDDR